MNIYLIDLIFLVYVYPSIGQQPQEILSLSLTIFSSLFLLFLQNFCLCVCLSIFLYLSLSTLYLSLSFSFSLILSPSLSLPTFFIILISLNSPFLRYQIHKTKFGFQNMLNTFNAGATSGRKFSN